MAIPKLALLLLGSVIAEECDLSCKGCSTNIVKVEALPCDASDAAQQGWAFGAAADAEGLRTITRGGLCLSWNPNHKGVELRECYAANGDSWTNATVRDCQHFAVDEAGGAKARRSPDRLDRWTADGPRDAATVAKAAREGRTARREARRRPATAGSA